MGRRIRSPHALAPALLLLGLASTPVGAEPGSFALECETLPGGIRSILIVADEAASLAGREVGPHAFVVEIGSPTLPGLAPGRARCSAATSVQVLPGTLLGLDVSRVVIEHDGAAPRVVSSPGQVRLLWVPAAPAPPEGRVPVAARTTEREPTHSPQARGREPAQRSDGSVPGIRATRAEAEPEGRIPAAPRTEPAPLAGPALRGEPGPRPPVPTAAALRTPPDAQTEAAPADFRSVDPPRELVTVIAAQLRAGAGRRFPPGRRLAEGTPLVADGRTADWYRLQGGEWIFAADVRAPADIPQPGGLSVRVSTPSAQVHAGPGRHFEVVAELQSGETLVLDDRRGEWVHVRNGGWIQLSQVDEKR